MASELSCLIVTGDQFPEERLAKCLAPTFRLTEFDFATSLSEAFQILLSSSFNLCLIGNKHQAGLESFFRDMKKIGRDKTCAFVKVQPTIPSQTKAIENAAMGSEFCAKISTELTDTDVKALNSALSKEIVRIIQEQRASDIPKYVNMVLKEIDNTARNHQRGLSGSYDKVIASLVKDMMGPDSTHKYAFIAKLSEDAAQAEGFDYATVEIPETVLGKNLPELDKNKYAGRSARVWNKLLKRYGTKP